MESVRQVLRVLRLYAKIPSEGIEKTPRFSRAEGSGARVLSDGVAQRGFAGAIGTHEHMGFVAADGEIYAA